MTADVLRFQAQGNELQGVRLFAVDNTSQPPRTQMNDQNFEFYPARGRAVDSSFAQTEGGQAVNSAPVPQTERNRYAFVFPLRPGETQFQLTFHVPYTGNLQFDPKSLYADSTFRGHDAKEYAICFRRDRLQADEGSAPVRCACTGGHQDHGRTAA